MRERYKKIQFTVPPELADAFRQYCLENKLNMSELAREWMAKRIKMKKADMTINPAHRPRTPTE